MINSLPEILQISSKLLQGLTIIILAALALTIIAPAISGISSLEQAKAAASLKHSSLD